MHVGDDAKKRLAGLIEQRDLKLAPIAKEIGTSYSTLWNFVYGPTSNFGKIHKLADALGVSLEWIQFGGPVDARRAFDDRPSSALRAREHRGDQALTGMMPLEVGVDLAIRAAIGDGRKPSAETLDFVRQSLLRLAAGAAHPLTEKEFIDYAKGFLAMKRK